MGAPQITINANQARQAAGLRVMLGRLVTVRTQLQQQEDELLSRLRMLRQYKREIDRKLERVKSRLGEIMGGRDIPLKVIQRCEQRVNDLGMMERIMQRRFSSESEHGPGSTKWRALSPEYRRWKIRQGYSAKRNQRTGELMFAALNRVAGTFKSDKAIRWEGLKFQPNYAVFVQESRPFHLNPNEKELEPARKKFNDLLAKEIQAFVKKGKW